MDDWRVPAAAGFALFAAAGILLLPGVLGTALGRRGRRPGVFGPLVAYELVRLARRGQQAKLRSLFAVVLFFALLAAFLNQFRDQDPLRALLESSTLPLDRSARFAEQFLATYLYCQLAAIVLVTPVFAGGGFTEDKDSGALDALRASHLTNREIVYGKLTARLAFVSSLVFVGLPVLALTMFFGGIDGGVLVCGFVVAFMSALSTAAFAAYLGVVRDSLREVLYWCYGIAAALLLFGFCCGCIPFMSTVSPFSATMEMLNGRPGLVKSDPAELAFAFTVLHGTVAALFAWRTCRRVRERIPERQARAEAVAAARRTRPGAPPRRPHRGPPRTFYVPRLQHNDPLLWKERYFSGRLPGFEAGIMTGCGAFVAGVAFLIVGMALFVGLLESISSRPNASEIVNPALRATGFAAAVALAPLAGVRAAAAVAGERQRDTLSTLLTLPVDRTAVLCAKWKAAAYGVRYWLLAGAITGCLGIPLGGLHPIGFAVAAALVTASLAFAVSLGLWFSVRCRTVSRAVTQLLVVLFVLGLGPHLLATLTVSAGTLADIGGGAEWVGILIERLCVPTAVYESLFRWRAVVRPGQTNPWAAAAGGAVAAAGYAGAAWLLWRRAVKEFEAEGR